MKFRSHSAEYVQRLHKSWHKFLAIWPRRVSDTEIAIGVVMRRKRANAKGYEFRTIDEHARVLLINGTRTGDPYLKSQMEEYTRRYKASIDADDE